MSIQTTMEALGACLLPSLHRTQLTSLLSSTLHFPSSLPPTHRHRLTFKAFTAVSPDPLVSLSPDQITEGEEEGDKFDWYSHWYPLVPICDLDKRRPRGMKVIGIDVVIWWDRNESEWRVFDDACPHRLAPLSEGRIDPQGRLQCVYHGWCFAGSGDCKFIPQAQRDGPPIHTSNKACVAAYPCCVQNGILWFWPNADPEYKDIYLKKKPHCIPELDDPSYTNTMIYRDISYGYEVLVENLMDPAHVPYAHHGIMRMAKVPESLKADREGGRPMEIGIKKLDRNGFTAQQVFGKNYFIPPCLFYGYYSLGGSQSLSKTSSATTKKELIPTVPPKKKAFLIFYCIPVSPGNSRLIFASPRNFAVWVERIFPRWIFHIGQNLILDSDLYLLHVEERKIKEIGAVNWHKSCYVPTKADAMVVSFRRWLNKYGGTQVDWRNKYSGELPLTPPREQLFDRYWSHTVKCSSCSVAYKMLNALEIVLQVASVSLIAIVAAAKQGTVSVSTRYGLVAMALMCFISSKWVSHFVYRTFRYHDYDHAFR